MDTKLLNHRFGTIEIKFGRTYFDMIFNLVLLWETEDHKGAKCKI